MSKFFFNIQGNAANSSETSMATQAGGSVTSRAASESRSGAPGSSSAPGNTAQTATGAKFRHGLLQLMIHTIDPLHDGKVHRTLLLFHKSFLNFFRFILFSSCVRNLIGFSVDYFPSARDSKKNYKSDL